MKRIVSHQNYSCGLFFSQLKKQNGEIDLDLTLDLGMTKHVIVTTLLVTAKIHYSLLKHKHKYPLWWK